MNRVISIVFLFFCFSSLSYSQSSTPIKHLEFMGIPITGELSDFVSKVISLNRGFKEISTENEDFKGFLSTKLEGGKFWKFDNCMMFVRYNKEFELVTSVIVNCDKAKEQDFEDIILSMDKKYGEHAEDEELEGWVKFTWWAGQEGRVIVTEIKKYHTISVKYEDFPEAVREAEKEIKKLMYNGQAEDVDL